MRPLLYFLKIMVQKVSVGFSQPQIASTLIDITETALHNLTQKFGAVFRSLVNVRHGSFSDFQRRWFLRPFSGK